jgi:hypothetical protein
MLPTPKSVHTDVALTNMSIAYYNTMFIANQVFPIVPVNKRSDAFYVFRKGAWFRNDAMPRGPGARAARSGYAVTTSTYSCIERALAHPVPIELIENADEPLDPFATGVRFVTNAILLAAEVLVSSLCTTAANWTTTNDANAGWVGTVDGSGNTFITDVLTAKETVRGLIGRYPNVMVMDAKTLKECKQEYTVLERIKYTGTSGAPADVTPNTLAQLFEFDRVLIGASTYSDAEEADGQADFNAVDLWETNATKGACWIGYVSPTPALEDPSAGYIFNWRKNRGYPIDLIQQNGYREVRRWWEDAEKQWVIEGSMDIDAQVCSADAGYLFTDTIVT